ncbi:MAG: SIS domain-containing protein [Blautia sp.]|nr:SIS domain-containing protein [Blautia sp.]
MFNFNEEAIRREHVNGLGIIRKTQEIVDEVCRLGYGNIFYIGIGGTILYAGQFGHIVKQLGSKLPLYLENAADFLVEGNPHFGKDSLVVIASISGDTKEIVQMVDYVHEQGAKVLGYVEKVGSPLYEKCDWVVTTTGGEYYFWYTVTLRLLANRGDFPLYDAFMEEIQNMPDNVVEIYKKSDAKAKEFADKYCDAPITYLVGSGNLEDWAVCYGMCIMEEMQWMRTRPISAANFFHGTLEVIERDIPVILIKGEDKTRPLMDRVERFVNTVSAHVTVFDTKDYELKGIREEFRWILAPIVARSSFQRVSVHLEHNRRHPLGIRRYYRRLEY